MEADDEAAGDLTDEQVGHFQEHGYLVLRGFVGLPVLQRWRRQFWAQHGADSSDPETWSRVQSREQDQFLPLKPLFGDLPQTGRALDRLGALREGRGRANRPICSSRPCRARSG